MSYSYGATLYDTRAAVLLGIADAFFGNIGPAERAEDLAHFTDADFADEWIAEYGEPRAVIVGQYDDDGEQVCERFTRAELIDAFARYREQESTP